MTDPARIKEQTVELISGVLAQGGLGWEAWYTLGVVIFMIAMLALTRAGVDSILVAGVTFLLVAGVLTPHQALSGMANEGMVTVAVLYVVVAGLENTGVTGLVVRRVLGRPKSVLGAMVKMMPPVTLMSAFLNNTPVVAMFIPVVRDWGKRCRIAVSKLMIPLSYAAVLGGTCTLIGTSTNLVVNGLLIAKTGHGMGMFEIAWVGVPCAIGGCLFILLAARWLLPDRHLAIDTGDDPREYAVEMIVESGSPLVGRTIEEAGLRHLPRCYLAEIERGGQLIPAVPPQERLHAGDQLVFVGVADSIADLHRIRGLKPATDQVFKLNTARSNRCLVEAVVSRRCPLVGQTIRDGQFRTVYNAVVLAVARDGRRIKKKIGDIVLRPGDNLLIEAPPSFVEQQRNSRHFYLVSQVRDSHPPRHDRAYAAAAIMAALIFVVSLEWLSMLEAGLLAAGAMIAARCCTLALARRSVDWEVLIAIAASFGVGRAIETTGLARTIAENLVGLGSGQPWLTLALVYGVTLVLTELISNNAAAVLVFPIACETARNLGVDVMPFVMAVTVAASLGFATPLGYQTHLMVYSVGSYRFTDFVKIGVPLDVLTWAIAVGLIPVFFPFYRS